MSRNSGNRSKHIVHNHHGQSMVEFALSLPFFLLIILTILYFGRFFYLKQVLLSACQQAALNLSSSPFLDDAQARALAVGFDSTGQLIDSTAPVAIALGNARLLSEGTTGNLPPGSSVKVLPFDAASGDATVPTGTVAVKIEYPFTFIGNPFDSASKGEFGSSVGVYTGEGGDSIQFRDQLVSEIAVANRQVSR